MLFGLRQVRLDGLDSFELVLRQGARVRAPPGARTQQVCSSSFHVPRCREALLLLFGLRQVRWDCSGSFDLVAGHGAWGRAPPGARELPCAPSKFALTEALLVLFGLLQGRFDCLDSFELVLRHRAGAPSKFI